MRQNCIDTIETTTAPLPSWGQWAKAGIAKVKMDTLQLWRLYRVWSMRAHMRRQMKDISDETLKDIAISRYDMEREARKPFWKE